jgi:hypothetical protein
VGHTVFILSHFTLSDFSASPPAPFATACCPAHHVRWQQSPGTLDLDQLHLFLEQAEGYVKALEKSTYPLSTMKEVFEHGVQND